MVIVNTDLQLKIKGGGIMNNDILKTARGIILLGKNQLKTQEDLENSNKAFVFLEKAIRHENEKINGKDIYCIHAVTSCGSCRDNNMKTNYTYEEVA